MILVVRCLWIDITYFIFIYFPESSDTLQKMAAFLCTHFIDQRIINPGVWNDCKMTAYLYPLPSLHTRTHTHTHTHTHCKLLPFSSQENHLPLCMSAIRSSFVSLIIVPFFPFWICDPSFLSVLARRFFTDLLASLVT